VDKKKSNQEEYLVITYKTIYSHRKNFPEADRIRAYKGNQGETGIYPNIKTTLEKQVKKLLGSNKKEVKLIFKLDRTLHFAKALTSKQSRNNKPISRSKSLNKTLESNVLGVAKKEPSGKSIFSLETILSLTVGSILILSLINIRNNSILAINPNESESEMIDPGEYIKNNAVTYYLKGKEKRHNLAISPNNSSLILATNNQIIFSDTEVYAGLKSIDIRSGEIQKIAISSEGKKAVAVKNEYDIGLLKILDSHGDILFKFRNDYPFSALAFSPNGKYIIAGDLAGTVKIFSLTQAEDPVIFFGHSAQINDILVTKNQIITASNDNSIRILNYQGEEIESFLDINEVLAIAQDRNGYIYSGNAKGTIRKWDLDRGEVETYQFHDDEITSLDLAGNILVSGSKNKGVTVFNTRNRHNKETFTQLGGAVKQVAISPDGKLIFVVTTNDILVWQNHQN